MEEILYCIYNAKELEKPILYEITDFKKSGTVYKFKDVVHNFDKTIDLSHRNIRCDSDLSTGDSPLERIYTYTTDKELALKVFNEECMDIGAGFFGGNYVSFMERKGFKIGINKIKKQEERLSKILFGLEEQGLDENGFFKKDGKILLDYDLENKILFFSDKHIDMVLINEFNLNSDEIKELMIEYVSKKLGIDIECVLPWL